LSSDPIEAAVGLACANALANGRQEGLRDGDILDHLDLRPADDVGMVGYFGPLVKLLKDRAHSLCIFERVERPPGEMLPISEAGNILPHCQVALITATAIINGTIDGLLKLTRGCREVVILGASTPLNPEAFLDANVTLLAGVMVDNPRPVLQVVSEGGGTRQFSPYVRKVNLPAANSKKPAARDE
jgi:uncharacterized protein (DUF4213/DUF364 family)